MERGDPRDARQPRSNSEALIAPWIDHETPRDDEAPRIKHHALNEIVEVRRAGAVAQDAEHEVHARAFAPRDPEESLFARHAAPPSDVRTTWSVLVRIASIVVPVARVKRYATPAVSVR